jgi:hypothetical protein
VVLKVGGEMWQTPRQHGGNISLLSILEEENYSEENDPAWRKG